VIKLFYCCLLALPLRHLSLSSGYGFRVHPVTGTYAFHSGIDLRARHDTVFAVCKGIVKVCGYDRLFGVHIILAHEAFESSYGHLSQIFVLPGDTVSAGEPIAITGATGRVTGEHLHFSIKFRLRSVDPLKFLLAIKNYLQIYNKLTNE